MYKERNITNPDIVQHLSDVDAVLFNEGKTLRRQDVMPKYNPRHLPVVPIVVDYITYQDAVVALGMYMVDDADNDQGYSYLIHRHSHKPAYP